MDFKSCIYQILPQEQDVTQGQFLSVVKMVFFQILLTGFITKAK